MRAAVAGAGIAGLTAAIALARRGWSVDIFERGEASEDLGAGIQLSPNAMAVLDRLGLAADLQPSLVEPRGIAIFDAPSGAFLNRVPLGEAARRRYGEPYAVIHRGDLQASLLRAALSEPGVTVTRRAEVSALRDGADAVRFDAGGESRSADILVAADGIHSRLRSEHFGHSAPRRLGKAAWRATLPIAEAPEEMSRSETGLWLGPGAHLVHYPLRGGAEMNLVVIAEATEALRPPLQAFGAAARRVIACAPAWRAWPLHEMDAAAAWARGRVVLVGDAAHAMLPSAAQGGAQAIEDAWVLAAVLAALPSHPAQALSSYEQMRRDRVRRVVRQARRNLAIYEMRGLSARARNAVIRRLPGHAHLARLDWLYGWKPGPEKA